MTGKTISMRIPLDWHEEIQKIARDMRISMPAAAKVWEERKFNLPKWKNV
jgi:hypothetical protein